MRYAAAAIVLAIPLAIAPRLFFYYDITPKAGVLLAGAAMLLLWAAWKPETALSFMTSRLGRWNASLTAAGVLLVVATAAASPILSLAWNGSNWRRFGAVEQVATVVCAFLVASIAQSVPRGRLAILRALCAAGVLAALYGTAQYFGFDPLLPAATYLVGEGKYQIARPPGPLGHADYLAAFLVWPVFAGTALWTVDSRRSGRWLGITAVWTGVIALVVAGSRGAWLGLFVGFAILVWLRRPRMRTVLASLAIFAVIATAFYLSPAGQRLRARAFWISADVTGGARLLLWRDSLRMSVSRPWTGFGPDNFGAEFPQFQSAELARAYPDFYHESPHNLFLDAWTGQGVLGVILLVLWMILGISAGRRSVMRAPPEIRPVASALLSGLAASLVAQQFVVFVVPTAFAFYLGIGLLAGLDSGGSPAVSRPLRMAVATCGVVAAVVLAAVGYRLVTADLALARVRRLLDAGDRGRAMELWSSAKTHANAGVTADLYFSRRWAAAASAAQEPLEKIRLGALAIEAARSATTVPEQRQSAWYNYAILAASLNDPKTVESSLRAAISAGPCWFKPHWALSRLLYSAGRKEEARQEALLALDLGGRRETEVIATTAEIVRSPASLP